MNLYGISFREKGYKEPDRETAIIMANSPREAIDKLKAVADSIGFGGQPVMDIDKRTMKWVGEDWPLAQNDGLCFLGSIY